jgi:hypothetical protein
MTKPSFLNRGVSAVQLAGAVIGLAIALGGPVIAAHDRLTRIELRSDECDRRMAQVETMAERVARIEEKLDALKDQLRRK